MSGPVIHHEVIGDYHEVCYMQKIEDLIWKAKIKVERKYEGSMERSMRKWIEVYVDSYESHTNRISFWVLEGSPPKGYVIVNYGHGEVLAFDAWNNRLYTYRTEPCYPSLEGSEDKPEKGQALGCDSGSESGLS